MLASTLVGVGQSWTKQYDRVDACNCGYALVEKNGKFGYVSEQGKVLVSWFMMRRWRFQKIVRQ